MRLKILNENVKDFPITELKVTIKKNWIGLASTRTSIPLSEAIGIKQSHICQIPLLLAESECLMLRQPKTNKTDFDFGAECIVVTNVFAIKCKLKVPIHIFFESGAKVPRDQFFTIWKSLSSTIESKLPIIKAKTNNIDQIKSLLDVHNLFFIHHQSSANKGDTLYYSTTMLQQMVPCEILIETSGKGLVCVRCSDNYPALLCVNAIRDIIDT